MDITVTSVGYNENGSVDIEFQWNGEKYSHQFLSTDQMIAKVFMPSHTVAETVRIAISYWYALDPKLGDPKTIIGKKLNVNLDGNRAVLGVLGLDPTLAWAQRVL